MIVHSLKHLILNLRFSMIMSSLCFSPLLKSIIQGMIFPSRYKFPHTFMGKLLALLYHFFMLLLLLMKLIFMIRFQINRLLHHLSMSFLFLMKSLLDMLLLKLLPLIKVNLIEVLILLSQYLSKLLSCFCFHMGICFNCIPHSFY